METKFQTSFIPKKPLLAQESAPVRSSISIFLIIGILAFILSVGGAGFTFVAKGVLEKSQKKLQLDLTENEKRFDLPTIEMLKDAELKIKLATQLLKNHVAVSETLDIMAGLTAQRVKFNSFEFSSSESSVPVAGAAGTQLGTSAPSATYHIHMRGVTDTFNSVAFQSDVMGESNKHGTMKLLKNPVLSDLTSDTSGNIGFNFTAEIMASDITYEKALSELNPPQAEVPVDAQTTN